MPSKYEIAAGIVQGWQTNFGDGQTFPVIDDIIEVLRICHEYRTPDDKKVPIYDADELGEAIAEYLIGSFVTETVVFDKQQAPAEVTNEHTVSVSPETLERLDKIAEDLDQLEIPDDNPDVATE